MNIQEHLPAYSKKQEINYDHEFELTTSGISKPSWYDVNDPIKFDKLNRNISSSESIDAVIVGGGISGLSTAYLLSKSGKKVILLEDGYIGSGETGRTTAHITYALDNRYYNLKKLHGKKKIRLIAESHISAINMIESIIKEEKIDCDFERLDGFLLLGNNDKKESLEKELEVTHSIGINDTTLISQVPNLSLNTGPCLLFPNQAQFHPLKYLKGLSKAVLSNGGEIYTETHVQDILPNQIKTIDGYIVYSKNIVIATNAPIVDKISKIYDKQQAYRTYVIGARIKKDKIPKALYWDTGDQNTENIVAPYHYVRIQTMPVNEYKNDNYDLLIIGGEDHLIGDISDDYDMQQRYIRLESWARDRFPIEDIKFQWSGQILEPKDGIAFIGYNPGNKENNVFIATGDSGNGITHGTIAGNIITDLILGKNNPWISLYNPSRISKERPDNLYSKRTNKENKNNQKLSSNKDNNDKTKKQSIQDLYIDQGIVLEEKKLAVYKDSNNKLHAYSSVCTHLGCNVVWNKLEKSFDCPCHGSRFSALTGNTINGPANNKLTKK